MLAVVLCGIPGSGKSTLSKLLAQYYDDTVAGNATRGGKHASIIVSFDNVGANTGIAWDESSFQLIRARCLAEVRAQMDCGVQSSSLSSIIPTVTTISATDAPSLLIIDDLMYLRSMRREIYVLGRDRNIPTFTIYLRTSLATATYRNSMRQAEAQINEETLRRIYKNLQIPDPYFIFDRHVFIVEEGYNEVRTMEDLCTAIRNVWAEHAKKANDRSQRLEEVTRRALESGAKEAVVAPSKLLDEIIRKIVSESMKEFNSLLRECSIAVKTNIGSPTQNSKTIRASDGTGAGAGDESGVSAFLHYQAKGRIKLGSDGVASSCPVVADAAADADADTSSFSISLSQSQRQKQQQNGMNMSGIGFDISQEDINTLVKLLGKICASCKANALVTCRKSHSSSLQHNASAVFASTGINHSPLLHAFAADIVEQVQRAVQNHAYRDQKTPQSSKGELLGSSGKWATKDESKVEDKDMDHVLSIKYWCDVFLELLSNNVTAACESQ